MRGREGAIEVIFCSWTSMAVDILHSLRSGHGDVKWTDTDDLVMLHVRLMNCECPRVEAWVYQGPRVCEAATETLGNRRSVLASLQ